MAVRSIMNLLKGAEKMEEKEKQLLDILKNYEGKDFDATLQDGMEGVAGFSFMSYVKSAKIRTGAGRVAISEPVTGKYFCLPLNGIKGIYDESSGKYDAAFLLKYDNGYNVFIQIFESWEA
jgi:hypothetical protein